MGNDLTNPNSIYVPNDIIILIMEKINLCQLITLERINQRTKKIIRTNRWEHFIVSIRQNKVEYLNYILNNYKFLKYDISNTNITDVDVSLLGGCHTLNLSGCTNITDAKCVPFGWMPYTRS